MDVVVGAALLIAGWATLWFLAALIARRNDIADVAWGLGFVAIAWWGLLFGSAARGPRLGLMVGLITIWGIRLAMHIGRRNLSHRHAEDPRYAEWRRSWGRWFVVRSYLQVFLLQGALALLVSAPVLAVIAHPTGRLGVVDLLGGVIWLAGLVTETVADAQLARHLARAENRGKPLSSGLWSLSRHPNYLGEACAWWGLGIIALSVPQGWLGLIGPLAITLLLRFVSGVPLLETRHKDDPLWQQYRARVPVFVPWPKRSR